MLNSLFQAIHHFRELLWSLPMFVIYAILCTLIVGQIKINRRWNTGYTRKIFHFMIFTAAAVIQLIWSFPGVMLFGGMVTLTVLWACFRGNKSPFYQAIARPKDAPHQTLFILLPLISTALGGLLSNLLFKDYAIFGYLVTGWGDAIAEPVGTRWGKHTYTVPSLFNVKAIRSWEGSMAVFIVGILACIALGFVMHYSWSNILIISLNCSLVGALVEAISNHGLDNLTVQISVSGMAFILIH